MKVKNGSYIFILVHLLCWLILAVGVLYNHPSDWGDNVPASFWIRQTILLILLMVVFYLNFYLLIPRLLIRQKVVLYILAAIGLITAVTCLNSGVGSVLKLNPFFPVRPHPPFDPRPGHPERHGHFDLFVPGMNLLMVGLGITISFIRHWQQEVQLRQQLEQEKVTAELISLKAQINPHFFFNALNTIYSYTLSDGDVARTAITNLSKMMRYVLYETSGGQTNLGKEIDFIQEYTELMKLRISRKTTVSLEVQAQNKEVMVTPMLFLPFVENAFKHGVSGIAEGHITILISHEGERVELVVRNTVYETRRVSEEDSNGIGLQNTTRRLDLLYPGKYTLSAGMVNETEYEARLKLML